MEGPPIYLVPPPRILPYNTLLFTCLLPLELAVPCAERIRRVLVRERIGRGREVAVLAAAADVTLQGLLRAPLIKQKSFSNILF